MKLYNLYETINKKTLIFQLQDKTKIKTVLEFISISFKLSSIVKLSEYKWDVFKAIKELNLPLIKWCQFQNTSYHGQV
jgi:hypothetical protein